MKSNKKRFMKQSSCASAFVFALALFAISCQQSQSPQAPTPAGSPTPAASAGITPADIPPGFGYPGDRNQIQAWADAWEIDKITQHTWDMWAGMTADSGQTFNGGQLPYWETWCGTEEVFGGTCGKSASPRARPGRPFRIASQLTHEAKLKGSAAAPGGTQVVSFNKFNPSMAQYLQAQHAGPGTAGPYNYTSVSSLIALNAAWPANTPTVDRKVEESPYQPTTTRHARFCRHRNQTCHLPGEGVRTYTDAAVAWSGSTAPIKRIRHQTPGTRAFCWIQPIQAAPMSLRYPRRRSRSQPRSRRRRTAAKHTCTRRWQRSTTSRWMQPMQPRGTNFRTMVAQQPRVTSACLAACT